MTSGRGRLRLEILEPRQLLTGQPTATDVRMLQHSQAHGWFLDGANFPISEQFGRGHSTAPHEGAEEAYVDDALFDLKDAFRWPPE